jgi:hypothetical protein
VPAFAVLLAFVVLEAYQSYNDAKSGAEAEAEAVLQLSRTVEAFEPQEHERLEGLLVCQSKADALEAPGFRSRRRPAEIFPRR